MSLPVPTPDFSVYPEFITAYEQDLLASFADTLFNECRQEWFGNNLLYDGSVNAEVFHTIGKRLPRFHLLDSIITPRIQNVLGLHELQNVESIIFMDINGSKKREHQDPRFRGVYPVFNCNLIVRAPDSGGTVTVAGTPHTPASRELHTYWGTEYPHAVSPLQSVLPRILYSIRFSSPRLPPCLTQQPLYKI